MVKVLIAFFAASIAVGLFAWRNPQSEKLELEGVDQGRRVYEQEGCVHCHSQYSRRGTLDTERWGPATKLPLVEGSDVLIGNRRQGPDLANVGLRRSREWNRLHLTEPDAISPGSRMPRYAHLFDGSGERGEALLDYLQSLQTEEPERWWQTIYGWEPKQGGDLSAGRRSYEAHCVQCHGMEGRGDGPLATRFAKTLRDLVDGPFLFAPKTLERTVRLRRLSQIVKYGLPGTSMPGHESLSDSEVASLALYLETLGE